MFCCPPPPQSAQVPLQPSEGQKQLMPSASSDTRSASKCRWVELASLLKFPGPRSTFNPTTRGCAFLPSAGRSIQPLHIRSTTDQQNSPKRGHCWSKPRPGGLFTSYLFFTKTVQNSYKTLVWGWAMTLIQKIIPMQSHQFHNLQGNR